MKDFEFKSSVCTSIEQSKRLLELGLKKETADMSYLVGRAVPEKYRRYWLIPGVSDYDPEEVEQIPAWSLHRLLEILFNGTSESIKRLLKFGYQELNYDMVITFIEDLINLKQFNKDYLE